VTSGHFIFIPGILLIGIVLGFILGGRAARDAFELQKRKDAERAAAKAAREARKQAAASAEPTPTKDQ
jgi:hypothetical protein